MWSHLAIQRVECMNDYSVYYGSMPQFNWILRAVCPTPYKGKNRFDVTLLEERQLNKASNQLMLVVRISFTDKCALLMTANDDNVFIMKHEQTK